MVSASAASLRPRAAPAAGPVLEIAGLVQVLGGRTVLELPAWTVEPGRHTLILGPSGSGKSTLLHLIAGLRRPTRGRIVIAGHDLGTLGAVRLDAFRGRTIGMVLQSPHLIGALTVRNNLRLARIFAGLPADSAGLARLLDELGLARLADARPRQLSQGEAQRVAIARAVINRPTLILADEPTSALDDTNAAAVVRLLRDQAEVSGATLVIATHDQRLKAHFADRLELPARP